MLVGGTSGLKVQAKISDTQQKYQVTEEAQVTYFLSPFLDVSIFFLRFILLQSVSH